MVIFPPTFDRQVSDANDNAPVFVHPRPPVDEGSNLINDSFFSPTSAASMTSPMATTTTIIQVWNKAASGHVITTVRAVDADSGANARLDYVLTAGNADGLLRLDRTSGTL